MRLAIAIAAIVVLAAISIGAGLTIRPLLTTARNPLPPIPPPTISSVGEFEEAMREKDLILHLDVDWAIQAAQSRPVVNELQRSLAVDPHYSHVVVRRIDLTDQKGPLWNEVARWLQGQADSHILMSGGNGAVIWVKSGRVVSSVSSAYQEGELRLLDTTKRIVASD